MASTDAPEDLGDLRPLDDEVHRVRSRGPLAWLLAAVTFVVAVGFLVMGARWAVAALELPHDRRTPQAGEATILPGQSAAVAATAGGRIVDVGCVVFGPIVVAPDGTGAFTVTSGASEVGCPGASFRDGMTLRWPADATPDTVPSTDP